MQIRVQVKSGTMAILENVRSWQIKENCLVVIFEEPIKSEEYTLGNTMYYPLYNIVSFCPSGQSSVNKISIH